MHNAVLLVIVASAKIVSKENQRLKEIVADLVLRYDIVKKSLSELD